MKKLLLSLCGSAISFLSISQSPIYDTGRLNTNAVIAPFTADGTLNFLSSGRPGYYVPKDSLTCTIYCGSLWVGGLDAGKTLHLAAQTYHQSGTDFWPGPIMNSADYSTHEDTVWNHVWVVYKSTIDSFRRGEFGSHIPASILNWPGNGDVGLGEMASLAPYLDSNHNGYYDPTGGDYPLIRGDMALYTIFNDDRGAKHTESRAEKLGIEVHLMAYQFKTTDTAINQATFLHYDIYNRSATNYDSVYFGSWIDMDVGDGGYNYIGCDSANNYWYTYDSKSYDSTPGSGDYTGEKGYRGHPAAQALAYVCDTMTHFMYYNNDYTVLGNPTTPYRYYDYMKNLWIDSTHSTYGGNGYGDSVKTNFVYSGNPATMTGWSQVSAKVPPADMRGISSIGPFTFNSHSNRSLDVALVFAQPQDSANNLVSVGMLPGRISDVRNYFYSQNYDCDKGLLGVNEIKPTAVNLVISVYPNPSNSEFYIQFTNVSGKVNLALYNIMGEQVLSKVAESTDVINISVATFPTGLYLLKAQTEDGSMLIKKVEVER